MSRLPECNAESEVQRAGKGETGERKGEKKGRGGAWSGVRAYLECCGTSDAKGHYQETVSSTMMSKPGTARKAAR